MITIVLTEEQMEAARNVGQRREDSSWSKRSRHGHNLEPVNAAESLSIHVEGAAAECAAAIALDEKWHGHVDVYKVADVGDAWEVRRRRSYWQDSLVRQNDLDELKLCHVYGEKGTYNIVGGRSIAELKEVGRRYGLQEAFGGREYAFFIPVHHLYPLDNAGIQCWCRQCRFVRRQQTLEGGAPLRSPHASNL